jgi:transcriptional regulator with XRE-family HTH domain
MIRSTAGFNGISQSNRRQRERDMTIGQKGEAEASNRSPAADAVRSYVKQLRASTGISAGDVAKQIGISARAYEEWEAGNTGDIKSVLLLRALDVLKGSATEVQRLAIADVELEIARSERQLLDARSLALAESVATEDLQAVLQALAELRSSPVRLARLVGYANALLEEQKEAQRRKEARAAARRAESNPPLQLA